MVLVPVARPMLATLQLADVVPQAVQVAVPLVGVQAGQAQVILLTVAGPVLPAVPPRVVSGVVDVL
jgi:hypothetical protein